MTASQERAKPERAKPSRVASLVPEPLVPERTDDPSRHHRPNPIYEHMHVGRSSLTRLEQHCAALNRAKN